MAAESAGPDGHLPVSLPVPVRPERRRGPGAGYDSLLPVVSGHGAGGAGGLRPDPPGREPGGGDELPEHAGGHQLHPFDRRHRAEDPLAVFEICDDPHLPDPFGAFDPAASKKAAAHSGLRYHCPDLRRAVGDERDPGGAETDSGSLLRSAPAGGECGDRADRGKPERLLSAVRRIRRGREPAVLFLL